jgi:hypothetical protein
VAENEHFLLSVDFNKGNTTRKNVNFCSCLLALVQYTVTFILSSLHNVVFVFVKLRACTSAHSFLFALIECLKQDADLSSNQKKDKNVHKAQKQKKKKQE